MFVTSLSYALFLFLSPFIDMQARSLRVFLLMMGAPFSKQLKP